MIKEKRLRKEIYKEKQEKQINIIIKILLIFIMIIFVSGCDKKTISAKQFTSKMENKGYSVVDVSDNSKTTILAVGDHYQVYYYKFNSVKKTNKSVDAGIKSLKSDNNIIVEDIKDNYKVYKISNNNVYTVYSEINDTYIYISTTDNYKNEVTELLNYLGY